MGEAGESPALARNGNRAREVAPDSTAPPAPVPLLMATLTVPVAVTTRFPFAS